MARILVAEDNRDVREWLAEILLGAGHEVTTARDGLEAKRLANHRPFDLIVTDILMPNEDGLGLIRYLQRTIHKSRFSQFPVETQKLSLT